MKSVYWPLLDPIRTRGASRPARFSSGRGLGLVLAAGLLAALFLLVGPATPAAADVITVTGTGNAVAADGQCTLREAIQAANTNAAVHECTRTVATGIDEIH